jgi:hypothetical protein
MRNLRRSEFCKNERKCTLTPSLKEAADGEVLVRVDGVQSHFDRTRTEGLGSL